MVIFSIIDVTLGEYSASLVEFTISGNGTIAPDELPEVTDQIRGCVDGKKGVIISGDGPVWLHGALLHELHAVRWAAIYDRQYQAAVVVSKSHPNAPNVGMMLTLV